MLPVQGIICGTSFMKSYGILWNCLGHQKTINTFSSYFTMVLVNFIIFIRFHINSIWFSCQSCSQWSNIHQQQIHAWGAKRPRDPPKAAPVDFVQFVVDFLYLYMIVLYVYIYDFYIFLYEFCIFLYDFYIFYLRNIFCNLYILMMLSSFFFFQGGLITKTRSRKEGWVIPIASERAEWQPEAAARRAENRAEPVDRSQGNT